MVNGFSSADPSLARGPQISTGEYTRRYGGGGGSSRSSTPSYKNVRIDGGTVFINGKGYSVAPSLQAGFIRKQTGGGGSSAQSAIKQAQEIQLKRQQQEAKKLADQIKADKEQKAFGQTIGGQVKIQKKGFNEPFGTRTDYNKQGLPPGTQIYTEPIIEKRTTGSFVDVSSGRNVPTTNYFLIEPPKYGSGGGAVKETVIKPSAITPSGAVFKIEGYKDVTIGKELEASSEKRTTTKKITTAVGGGYDIANIKLREAFTDPLAGFIVEKTKGTSFGGETGLTLEKAKSNIKESTEFLISKGISSKVAKTGEFISGAGVGITEDVRYKPAKQVAILGATAGIGYGLGAVTAGATTGATALFGTRAGLYTGAGLKTAQIGAGVVLGGGFAIKTGTAIKAKVKEGDYLGAGSIIGVAGKDVGIGVYGFKTGQQLFTQTRGWWATRGREELIIKQGDYPTAPSSKQLKMFQKNVIKELGAKPGAFHTTSEIFYKGGKITPKAGTSELPGLYGSTQISRPFARISGSGGKGNILTSLKNWRTWFKVEGKPGVAYLQPEKFRYSQAVKSPNIIGETKFSYRFVKPAKAGVADVPLIKSEIEAIFRIGTGEYGFTSGKYYTTIKGVRVPIDVFGYSGTTGTTTTPILNLPPTPTYSGLSAKGYYSGVPSSSLSPVFGITTSIIPSSSSSKVIPSSSASLISSYKPSYSSGYSYSKPYGSSSYIYGGSSSAFGSSSKSSGSSSSLSYIYGGSSSTSSSSSGLLPGRPGGLLPKFPKIREKAKRKINLFGQPTQYQPSLTASILGIRGRGIAPGALSIRGVVSSKRPTKKEEKKKKFSIL